MSYVYNLIRDLDDAHQTASATVIPFVSSLKTDINARSDRFPMVSFINDIPRFDENNKFLLKPYHGPSFQHAYIVEKDGDAFTAQNWVMNLITHYTPICFNLIEDTEAEPIPANVCKTAMWHGFFHRVSWTDRKPHTLFGRIVILGYDKDGKFIRFLPDAERMKIIMVPGMDATNSSWQCAPNGEYLLCWDFEKFNPFTM